MLVPNSVFSTAAGQGTSSRTPPLATRPSLHPSATCLHLAYPVAGSAATGQPNVAAINAAIKAQSKAAVAQGQPATWLVSFRTSPAQIADQAQAISAASALPADQAMSLARQQVFASVKTRVLGAAVLNAANSLVGPELVGGGQPQGSLQIERDYANLPITAVSISSAAELQRLRAHQEVLSVTPNLVARVANTQAFNLVSVLLVQGLTLPTIVMQTSQGSALMTPICT